MRRAGIIAGSIALLAAASGIGFYIYMRLQPVPASAPATAPFILVDDTKTVTIGPTDTRSTIMQALTAARAGSTLSLGLMARIAVAKPTALNDGSLQEVSAPEFLQILAPRMPLGLVRTLEPQMLLGLHSYDETQVFMILKADSYETAYSGMLAWEATMQQDLSPLFSRTPAVHARTLEPAAAVGTTTATSSQAASSTLPAAAPASFFQGNFIDQVVDNHDARVILNSSGDTVLLWTMLDRSTIVITTNEATLREVISRLSQASILSLPGGQ